MIKRKITERLERFFSDDGCYALLVDGARQVPVVPLVLSKRSNLFKLFMNDVGLLAASYMDGILHGRHPAEDTQFGT